MPPCHLEAVAGTTSLCLSAFFRRSFVPNWRGMCAWALASSAVLLVVLVKTFFSDLGASEGIEVATLHSSPQSQGGEIGICLLLSSLASV